MKEIKGLDCKVYHEKLDNGLNVYVVPNNSVNNTYATYTTLYGGRDNEFYINDKLVSVPMGIAHFLEHKMFEMKDGSDVFNFFSERGSNCNANTTGTRTCYLFSGPNSFYENLEYLLKYVEEPYFTDKNVEKEKGIIGQEIMMYKDNPYSRMYDEIMYNTLINHPLKYPTIGTIESVNSITKENLYDCYNTFYHPSNMFIVVTGNVDVSKTFDTIKKHEEKRVLEKAPVIRRKEFNEPDKVYKKNVDIKMDVTIPKAAIAFKINVKNINMKDTDIYTCLLNMVDLKVGPTSLFTEKMKQEGFITDTFDTSIIKCDDHFIVVIDFETTSDIDVVIEKVINEVKDLSVNKKDFERRKKVAISGLLFVSDNIYKLNDKIISDIINRGSINYNPIEDIKNYDIKNVDEIIKNINMDNYSIIKILPKA